MKDMAEILRLDRIKDGKAKESLDELSNPAQTNSDCLHHLIDTYDHGETEANQRDPWQSESREIDKVAKLLAVDEWRLKAMA
jgi:hypothetical protein